jgi:transposase
MKHEDDTTKVAGVDVSKDKLDIIDHRSGDHLKIANDVDQFAALGAWLRAHGVVRVGMEATGGYEHAVRIWLDKAGFGVVVHQPAEVKHFAKFKRIRIKTDKADAALIAAATVFCERTQRPYDAVLDELCQIMTFYEHVTTQLAQCRGFGEHAGEGFVREHNDALIEMLEEQKKAVEAQMKARIEADPDLLERYDILHSIPGIGDIVSLSLLIRMPELGQLEDGQAASLLGVAPFQQQSGKFQGQTIIQGGRERPRRHVYLAAIGAIRTKRAPYGKFAQALKARGKAKKVALVAVMRKLIELANLLLKQKRHWIADYPPKPTPERV